jgi:hypothetical protein
LSEFSDIGQLLTLGSFFLLQKKQKYLGIFFHGRSYLHMYYFDQKIVRATFWAIFSQTLVYTTVKIWNKLQLSEKENNAVVDRVKCDKTIG